MKDSALIDLISMSILERKLYEIIRINWNS